MHRWTRNSELGVPLGSVEHGGRVAGDLRDTLDIDPNPNGILPLHHLLKVAQHITEGSPQMQSTGSTWLNQIPTHGS